jgi:nucleoside-diphosphate-sugar epimerase
MRVAIAGGGSLAKYFAEELPKAGHEVVILTRAAKPFFEGKSGVVAQRTTDYSSVDDIEQQIHDCEALLSTIVDYSPAFTTTHLNMIEACKKSPKCKRFIPSEYGGDVESYPDQPAYYGDTNGPVREALRNQTELEWTIVCIGIFAEMYVPKANHHFSYIPDVADAKTNSITISGTGEELISMTSARDVAKAVGQLLLAPKGTWRPYVYMEGHKTTQLHVMGLLKQYIKHHEIKVVKRSLTQMIHIAFGSKEPGEAAIYAQHGICMVSGATTFDAAKVARDRAEHFPDLHFRTIDEMFATLARDPHAQL